MRFFEVTVILAVAAKWQFSKFMNCLSFYYLVRIICEFVRWKFIDKLISDLFTNIIKSIDNNGLLFLAQIGCLVLSIKRASCAWIQIEWLINVYASPGWLALSIRWKKLFHNLHIFAKQTDIETISQNCSLK